MPDCKCEFLQWLRDGDRRLFCPNCKKMFVLIDGEPVAIEGAVFMEEK